MVINCWFLVAGSWFMVTGSEFKVIGLCIFSSMPRLYWPGLTGHQHTLVVAVGTTLGSSAQRDNTWVVRPEASHYSGYGLLVWGKDLSKLTTLSCSLPLRGMNS